MGGSFREKLEEGLRIKFRGFKFRGAKLILTDYNLEWPNVGHLSLVQQMTTSVTPVSNCTTLLSQASPVFGLLLFC